MASAEVDHGLSVVLRNFLIVAAAGGGYGDGFVGGGGLPSGVLKAGCYKEQHLIFCAMI